MIREYRPEDSDELYAIALSSLDEMYEPSVFYYFHSQWPAGQIVACDYAGHPIGFLCSTRVNNNQARIMMFAVRQEYRHQGIGQSIIDRFRMNAVMSGITFITLEVKPSNTAAVRFYKRNGFKETNILPRFYQDGGDAIRMDGPTIMFS